MILQNNLPEKDGNTSFQNTEVAFRYKSNTELKESYRLYKIISSNFLIKAGPFLRKFALDMAFPVKSLIKRKFHKQFCGGETIRANQPIINKLSKNGVGAVLDYCVTGKEEEATFNATANEVVKNILKARGASKYIPFCSFRISGLIRNALLEKLNNSESLNETERFELTKAEDRIDQICKTAHECDVRIMIEAEESWIQNAIDSFAVAMILKYNKEKPVVFNTYQLYRRDKLSALKTDILMAEKQDFFLGAKLVKGAYLEREKKRALEKGYLLPLHATKEATDQDYNLALQLCFNHKDKVAFILGTHNSLSCSLLMDLQKTQHVPLNHKHIHYAQRYGMSDHLSFNLADAGCNVSKNIPYGPIKPLLAHLLQPSQEYSISMGHSAEELLFYKQEMKRRGI